MKIAVCGPKGFPSWRARGSGLAEIHGWDMLDCRKPIPRKYETIWLVKRHLRDPFPDNLRQSCDRLIMDPLDFWPSPASLNPYTCWRTLWEELAFDDLIATSPASRTAMCQGLEGCVPVHLMPHQCDYRIQPDWYDSNGPLVYAGSRCFVSHYQKALLETGQLLGRTVLLDFSQHHSWRSLKGAALQICLRFPPHNGPWNRLHRPQIKLENSAAGGIPIIYNGHECETSLHPGHIAIELSRDVNPHKLAVAFERALDSPPPSECYNPCTFYRDAALLVMN